MLSCKIAFKMRRICSLSSKTILRIVIYINIVSSLLILKSFSNTLGACIDYKLPLFPLESCLTSWLRSLCINLLAFVLIASCLILLWLLSLFRADLWLSLNHLTKANPNQNEKEYTFIQKLWVIIILSTSSVMIIMLSLVFWCASAGLIGAAAVFNIMLLHLLRCLSFELLSLSKVLLVLPGYSLS